MCAISQVRGDEAAPDVVDIVSGAVHTAGCSSSNAPNPSRSRPRWCAPNDHPCKLGAATSGTSMRAPRGRSQPVATGLVAVLPHVWGDIRRSASRSAAGRPVDDQQDDTDHPQETQRNS
jgi:hypothetical protein